MKSNGLKFEEETVATPAEITFCNNKIWSGNAGRTANCLMVGDIRAIKKTVTIKWYHLTGEQTAQINKYISNVDSPFFNATLLDETFNEIKIRVYAGDPSYEIFGWDEKRQFAKALLLTLSCSRRRIYVYNKYNRLLTHRKLLPHMAYVA